MKSLDEYTTDALLAELTLRGVFPNNNGGVLELSEFQGEGAAWTRRELRSMRAALIPATVEGSWFVAAAIRGMASGHFRFGFGDAGLKRAAQALSRQLDKVMDLYDS